MQCPRLALWSAGACRAALFAFQAVAGSWALELELAADTQGNGKALQYGR